MENAMIMMVYTGAADAFTASATASLLLRLNQPDGLNRDQTLHRLLCPICSMPFWEMIPAGMSL
tara:strand:+ start:217 stop:408 length:192 start_codon:yes stop_codon:yes gene_type:complete